MMPVGVGNTQPYLFVTDNYASFNKDRHSVSLPHSTIQLKGTGLLQTGVTPTTDFTLNILGVANWQNNHSGGGFGDVNVVAGFLVNQQSLYVPQVKLTISQTFPTGKYKNLNNNGLLLDAVGLGAYSTQVGLGFGKILCWTTKHPMNTRLFLGYQLSTVVNVRGFNTYGGGFDTHGRVRPGNVFTADFGYEISISQPWVAAIDVVYTATNATKFHGHTGTLADGTPASVGGGYSDNLSLAPAIEYNWNANLGVIAGAWFSVYGRNSTNFASGIFSVTYTFP
jgi:hypothetical protein